MLRFLGILLLLFFLLLLGASGGLYMYLSSDDEAPRIAAPSAIRMTDSGPIIGFQGKHGAHTWLGVPYAEAPSGDLRWLAPRPAVPWVDRREVLQYGSQCIQLPAISGSDRGRGIVGSEDCLQLNIWAPTFGPTTVPKGEDQLPVMLWIHGGGNSIGSGGSDLMDVYDGSLMATEHNVIVVSVNYRLGVMGWFAHDSFMAAATSTEDASGNFGTLDLVATLQWIHSNIATFGGNAHNVTIFGESAGGTNVLSLVASPWTQGLFHQAIVQSGDLDIVPMNKAQEIGEDSRGESILSSKELVARWLVAQGRAPTKAAAIKMQNEMPDGELALWLRSLSAEDLYSIFDGQFAGMIEMPMVLGDGFVLQDMTTAEIFSNANNFVPVPMIIGSNRDETALFMGFSPDYVEFSGNYPTRIKDPAGYRRDVGYASDLWRVRGVDRIAERISELYPNQIFAYRFDADDWRDYGVIDLKELLGAAHALEIPFVFGYFPAPSKLIFPDSTFDDVELLSNSMMSYWAEFATNGKPGRGRFGEEPLWEPWRQAETGHLNILDTDLDGGIRMHQKALFEGEIRAEFIADKTYASVEEKCKAYRNIFWADSFSQTEYESLGCL